MAMNPHELTPAYIVDLFISDCILPSTIYKEQVSDVFEVFKAYCESVDIGLPCEIRHFGKLVRLRFQRRLMKGRSYIYLEYKPGLFDAND
jgi:hypothetical protein